MSAHSGILSRMRLHGGEHGRSFLNLFFEVALITIGVFLALWANNWHEDREHRAEGQAALRNFAEEIKANREATQHYRQYHETLARELHEFLTSNQPADSEHYNKIVHFEGMRPVNFEHTAWDLALATQALSYLKPELAFEISKVYTQQNGLQRLQDSFLAAAFTPTGLSTENIKGLATAMEVYLTDVNQQEPAMISSYDKIIPDVRQTLGNDTR